VHLTLKRTALLSQNLQTEFNIYILVWVLWDTSHEEDGFTVPKFTDGVIYILVLFLWDSSRWRGRLLKTIAAPRHARGDDLPLSQIKISNYQIKVSHKSRGRSRKYAAFLLDDYKYAYREAEDNVYNERQSLLDWCNSCPKLNKWSCGTDTQITSTYLNFVGHLLGYCAEADCTI
jgi:hypothetical protein